MALPKITVDPASPPGDSREPVRATGYATLMAALFAALLGRYAGMEPEVAFGVWMVLAQVVTVELARRRVFSPATVARFQDAARRALRREGPQ